jgi:hypothetical protein
METVTGRTRVMTKKINSASCKIKSVNIKQKRIFFKKENIKNFNNKQKRIKFR